MKLEPIDIDTMYWQACRGNVHLFMLRVSPDIPISVPLWSGSVAVGQLAACRLSKADGGYWCRYDFGGQGVVKAIDDETAYPGHPWHWTPPLQAGARSMTPRSDYEREQMNREPVSPDEFSFALRRTKAGGWDGELLVDGMWIRKRAGTKDLALAGVINALAEQLK